MCCVLMTATIVNAEDNSALLFNAGSYSGIPEIQFVVSSPSNQRTGYFPGSGVKLEEIPDASYGVTRLGDVDNGPDANDWATLEFSNNGPITVGTYTITFYGFAETKMWYSVSANNSNGDSLLNGEYAEYISSGAILNFMVFLDPAPGSPAPVVIKTVTFDVLRGDVSVAWKLNQLGGDKFAASLVGNLNLAEKLAGVCGKRKAPKGKGCEPAANILKLFVKRLELANRKCDAKDPKACDEDKDWDDFRKEHGKDHDYDDFFKAWDRDEWHKHKKACKRFITDEALGIIRSDAEILLKTFVPDKSEHKGGK